MLRSAAVALPLTAFCAQAQVWCTPGASWHYRAVSFIYDGYYHRAYTGDTVLLGQPAQRIVTNGMLVYLPGTPGADTSYIVNQVQYTALQNEVLMVPAWSPNGLAWDTLLRFDAVPGDRWYLPNYEVICSGQEPFGMLQVTDTGHVVVDGVVLRRWSTATLAADGQILWSGESYFDRVGFLSGLVPMPFCGSFSELGESLKCYWDNDLTFIAPGQPIGTTCDITLNAPSPEAPNAISAAPNPGRDQLSLTLPPGSHRVALIDALGRVLATHANLSGTAAIATAHLPPGPYVIRVEGREGMRASVRWVKE